MTNIAIETTFTTDDSVQFDANYTANAPINFILTLNGTGNYFLGAPFGNVTNSTSSTFPSFYAYLVSAPAGSTFNESSWDDSRFSNGTIFLRHTRTRRPQHFMGRPASGPVDDRDWCGVSHIRFRAANCGDCSDSSGRSRAIDLHPWPDRCDRLFGYCAHRFQHRGNGLPYPGSSE